MSTATTTAELTSLINQLARMQTPTARKALLMTLDNEVLARLEQHYASYNVVCFPDGEINRQLVIATRQAREHAQAVLVALGAEAKLVEVRHE